MLSKVIGTLSAAQLGKEVMSQQVIDDLLAARNGQPGCEEQPFCDRFRQFMDNPDLKANSDVYYSIGADSVQVTANEGEIKA